MTREYPQRPIIGVGVVVWHADRVLLVRRANPPLQGQWSLLGGGQEVGETVFETARREAQEEAGIEVEPLQVIDVVDSIHRDAQGGIRFHYTLIDLLAEWRGGRPTAGGDALEVAWFTDPALDSLDLTAETLRVLRRGRELLTADRGQSKP